MNPAEASRLLKKIRLLVGKGGELLIGVDLKKNSEIVELAYDDPDGVTAEFNYNLLDRLNRDFSASFDRNLFNYSATYNKKRTCRNVSGQPNCPKSKSWKQNIFALEE